MKKVIIAIIALLSLGTLANFVPKTKYTVMFDTNEGNKIEEIEINSDEVIKINPYVYKNGYEFLGWYKDKDYKNLWNISLDKVTSDLTLYAKWEQIIYDVEFKDYEGVIIATQKVLSGNSAVAPEVPIIEGYNFIGWSEDFNEVNSNLTVLALYEPDLYQIVFLDDNNNIISTKKVFHGGDVQSPLAPKKDGYNFIGWDSSLEDIKENKIIRPIYEKVLDTQNKYRVVFVSYDGKVLLDTIVNENEGVIAPAVPIVEGYDFIGWSEEFDFVTNDLVIIAKYQLKLYEVFIDDTLFLINHGEKINKPNDPIKEDYKFKNWLSEGKEFDFNIPVTSNIKIISDFIKVVYTVKTQEEFDYVLYDLWDVSEVIKLGSDLTIQVDSRGLFALNNIVLDGQGYELSYASGFMMVNHHPTTIKNITINTDSDEAIVISNSDNVVLTDVEIKNGNVIIFNSKVSIKNLKIETNELAAIDIQTTSTVYVDNLTYVGSEAGVIIRDTKINNSVFITGLESYVPKEKNEVWFVESVPVAPKYHTVTFIDYNGKTLKSSEVEESKAALAPNVIARQGYNFVGWSENFDSITSDLIVVAIYQVKTYKITINGVVTEVNHGDLISEPAAPNKENHVLMGWKMDNRSTYNFSNPVTRSFTLDPYYLQNKFEVSNQLEFEAAITNIRIFDVEISLLNDFEIVNGLSRWLENLVIDGQGHTITLMNTRFNIMQKTIIKNINFIINSNDYINIQNGLDVVLFDVNITNNAYYQSIVISDANVQLRNVYIDTIQGAGIVIYGSSWVVVENYTYNVVTSPIIIRGKTTNDNNLVIMGFTSIVKEDLRELWFVE